ncbi:MAG: FAD-dependent monooxygenase [Desulfobacterales bacterium]|nr:FAD-dependent monooxygenase [Desulfobacterales bacterium]
MKLPSDYTEGELRRAIEKALGIGSFTYRIETKSLDARKKSDIHWLVRVAVVSGELGGSPPPAAEPLCIPFRKGRGRVLVVGSGPAGFFSALILQRAGYETTLIERGAAVAKRADGIRVFEKTGRFNPVGNYAFGEGGAGTFSDGKLTSRTKKISREKDFVLSSYIDAGAPQEIAYMAHPHLGSDNLRKIVHRLRKIYEDAGGTLLFETMLQDLTVREGRVIEAVTTAGSLAAAHFIIAPGHSAHETYRMLIRRGVAFRAKPFAVGCRVEHPQEIINRALWGKERLPGVKAAEYRLTSRAPGRLPVYTFCMCPGGVVVPATAYADTNIVNGMSLYGRSGKFANAACVAAVDLQDLLGRSVCASEALDWLGELEARFFSHTGGFQAPCCRIGDFITQRPPTAGLPESSYPLGLAPAPLWELLPGAISRSLQDGLGHFGQKLKGFDTGIIMGLESKTSSPVQVVREKNGPCAGVANLYVVGEGSGFAGGIISSAADGIRTAMGIIEKVA